MNGKIAALIAVAVFGLVCLAPMVADDSSAETYERRVSTVYIYQADFEIVVTGDLDENYLYMIDGSSNHAAMEAYLKDPQNAAPPTGDDRSRLMDNIGGTVHVYEANSWDYTTIGYGGEWKDGTIRLAPYNISDLFKGDVEDLVKLRINSVTDNTGKELEREYIYIYTKGLSESFNTIYVGKTSKFVIEEDSSFFIRPEWSSTTLCYNLDFDLEILKPNGSATTFMAICFVISAITIALLAYGALKPKWSK